MTESVEMLLPVRVVVSRTGVSGHLLRAWERRYGAVRPQRSSGGQRRYSESDVERIQLLRDAVAAGEAISTVARYSDDELRELLRSRVQANEEIPLRRDLKDALSSERALAFDSVRERHTAQLRDTIHRVAVLFPGLTFMEEFLSPLLRGIGDAWSEGVIGVAEEHLASEVIRESVGEMVRAAAPSTAAPSVICTTPPGHRHEFGALLAGLAAAYAGWIPIYPGPDLPFEEIHRLGDREGVCAVALSILFAGPGAHRLESGIQRLRQRLPPATLLYVGGNDSVKAIARSLHGVEDVSSYSEFVRQLRSVAEAHRGS